MNPKRFWEKVDIRDLCDCWNWKGAKSGTGYGYFYLNGRMLRAHRVAYALVHNCQLNGRVVMHTCDNPLCCNPSHLRPGTQADNMADMKEKGRALSGERNPAARLSTDDIRQIYLLSAYQSHGEIARRFGVTRSNVSKILSGKSWSHAVDILKQKGKL